MRQRAMAYPTSFARFRLLTRVTAIVLLALFLSAAPATGIPECIGDCNSDGDVTIDEIILMVDLVLNDGPTSRCSNGDANDDHQITIDEIVAAVGNALSGCSPFVSEILRAHLTGDQETPPIVSSATGTAVMNLSVDEQLGVIDLTVEGVDLSQVLASHLHVGPPGVPGPIVYTLFHIVDGEPFHSPWHVTLRPQDLEQDPGSGVNTFADLIAKIRAGGIYVNVHTQRNGGGGEIRGQLLPDPSFGSFDTLVGREAHTGP